MAKWSGTIGYIKIEEIEKGVWAEGDVIERIHFGDMISDRNKSQQSSYSTNNNISLMNKISIIIDSFAMENFHCIRYATIRGIKWNITDVEVQYPRLILTTGGVYNGK